MNAIIELKISQKIERTEMKLDEASGQSTG